MLRSRTHEDHLARQGAGARVPWVGPTGEEEWFELTDALLPDGTYAAEPLALYR
ncbi:hypothetical protein ABZY57_04540 [Streptomyces sp. NPDC006450]|uniref:hypothetical protein n=1 Tax=Streptomyces sp. NPDC006450 TaxID=3155458 RepID=UPI0033BC15E6